MTRRFDYRPPAPDEAYRRLDLLRGGSSHRDPPQFDGLGGSADHVDVDVDGGDDDDGGDDHQAPEAAGRPLLGPRSPARLRLDPGRPGALALCAVAVVAAVLSAAVTWIGRPTMEPVTAPPVVAQPAGGAASGGTGERGPGSPPGPATSETVVVAVVGLVVTPGLVTLPAGSRVDDAVSAAGGALPDADLTTVNLARVLVDGEQIAVGVPGAPPVGGPSDSSGTPLVNLNTATEQELEGLPGVGPVLAGRIVDYRSDSGGFATVDQLQDVDGIGPSTFAELRDLVTV